MYRLELNEQMMSVLINALGNYAFKDAAPVVAEIQRQVNGQRQPMMNGGIEKNVGASPSTGS